MRTSLKSQVFSQNDCGGGPDGWDHLPGDQLHPRGQVPHQRDHQARALLPQAEPSREGRRRGHHLQGKRALLRQQPKNVVKKKIIGF